MTGDETRDDRLRRLARRLGMSEQELAERGERAYLEGRLDYMPEKLQEAADFMLSASTDLGDDPLTNELRKAMRNLHAASAKSAKLIRERDRPDKPRDADAINEPPEANTDSPEEA